MSGGCVEVCVGSVVGLARMSRGVSGGLCRVRGGAGAAVGLSVPKVVSSSSWGRRGREVGGPRSADLICRRLSIALMRDSRARGCSVHARCHVRRALLRLPADTGRRGERAAIALRTCAPESAPPDAIVQPSMRTLDRLLASAATRIEKPESLDKEPFATDRTSPPGVFRCATGDAASADLAWSDTARHLDGRR